MRSSDWSSDVCSSDLDVETEPSIEPFGLEADFIGRDVFGLEQDIRLRRREGHILEAAALEAGREARIDAGVGAELVGRDDARVEALIGCAVVDCEWHRDERNARTRVDRKSTRLNSSH